MKPKLVRPIWEPDPRRRYYRDLRENWRDIERKERFATLTDLCLLLLTAAGLTWLAGWLWRVLF